MFNLIKMDTHRLVHSTSTWITLLFTVVLAVFSVVMTNVDIQMAKEDPSSLAVKPTEEIQLGIYVDANPEWVTGNIEIGDIISTEMKSGVLAIIVVVFAAIFSNAEQKNGYIKNIAGQFPRRGNLIISKFAAIAIQIFWMMIVFSLITVITGFALWGSRFYLGSFMPILKFLGTQYLLHLGFAALIMFFSIFTRSTAFSMTAGILICTGFAIPIYSIINKLIADIKPSWDFNVGNYMLDRNITQISLAVTSDIMVRGVVVGIVFSVISVLFAMLIIKKRDIR